MSVSPVPKHRSKLGLHISEGLNELGSSFLFKVFIFCLVVSLFASAVYSIAEGVTFFEAFFVSLISIMTEYGVDPETTVGKMAVYAVMVTGLILLAFLIGEVSKRFLENFLTSGKIKTKKRFWSSGHIVILGCNTKIAGILCELRSPDLEETSYHPIVVLAKDVGDVRVDGLAESRDIVGINGDPLVPENLERANVGGARSILILSDGPGDAYSDTKTVLAFNTLRKYLESSKEDKHIVVEFIDHTTNLLPFGDDYIGSPEVYNLPLSGGGKLIVEPVYLEKMPTYLLVQSLFASEINTVVQRLLSTQFKDSNEFYYIETMDSLVDRSFFEVEKALLDSNCTPVGFLRDENGKKSLFLNPSKSEDVVLNRGDRIVLVSYKESGVQEARSVLQKGLPKGIPGRTEALGDCSGVSCSPPFKRLVLLNWSKKQSMDLFMELDKIMSLYNTELEVSIASSHPDETKQEMERVVEAVEKAAGRPTLLKTRIVQVGNSMGLEDLNKLGIQKGTDIDLRVLALYNGEKDSDMKNLHRALMIENRISRKIFTAVEVSCSENYNSFLNTDIDVVVSINDFCEKLLAQAVLKPYLSLVFRNLLTFSSTTNEFYVRDIPSGFVGKPLHSFKEAMIGKPAVFLAHIRETKDGRIISINPKSRSKASQYDNTSIVQNRIFLEDVIQEGDRALLISYDPECVGIILSQLS